MATLGRLCSGCCRAHFPSTLTVISLNFRLHSHLIPSPTPGHSEGDISLNKPVILELRDYSHTCFPMTFPVTLKKGSDLGMLEMSISSPSFVFQKWETEAQEGKRLPSCS